MGEDSLLIKTLSPNGLLSDFIEMRETRLMTDTVWELRQVRRGDPRRAIFSPVNPREMLEMISDQKKRLPRLSFGEPSRLYGTIPQRPGHHIELLATSVSVTTMLEVRQVRPSGSRSIYLPQLNVSELASESSHSTLSTGPFTGDFVDGAAVVRCRACEQPLFLTSGTTGVAPSCSTSCRTQRPHWRAQEYRNAVICELASRGAERKHLAERFDLVDVSIHQIIHRF